MKIGAILESFRKDFFTSLKEAKKVGADGIQAYAGAAFPFDATDADL